MWESPGYLWAHGAERSLWNGRWWQPGREGQAGGLAQLGERRVRNAEVEGSNPLPSTKLRTPPRPSYFESS